jgi:DNA-binding NarL/FixJ family response regulator
MTVHPKADVARRDADITRTMRRFDAPRWLSGDIEATKRRLPERQRHVLDGLEAGHTQREMARALGVSRATIRKEIVAMRIHLKRIFGKISEI